MKLSLITSYTMTATTTFELPEGKTWDDVKDWSVKYCRLVVLFDDGTEFVKEADEVTTDSCDFKWPDRAEVFPTDENGYPDWSAEALATEYS